MSKPLRHDVWGKAPKWILGLSPRIAELAHQFGEQLSSGGKFHPGQDVQTVFGPETQLGHDLIALAEVAGLEQPEFRDIIDVRNFFEKLKGLAPASWLEGGKRVATRLPPKYQKTSRVFHNKDGTTRPWYEQKAPGNDKKWRFQVERKCPSEEERKKDGVPAYLRSRKQAEHYLWILARLEGRLLNMEAEGLRCAAAVISKIRLADLAAIEAEEDELTRVFCLHLAANWCMPKLFTLEKQSVGGMDEMAQLLWPYLLESPTTNWFLVAHLMIVPEVYDRLTREQLEVLREKAQHYFSHFVGFLDREWKRGVWLQAQKLMVMPRRFAKVQNPKVPRQEERFPLGEETRARRVWAKSGWRDVPMPSIGNYHVFVDVAGWNAVAQAYNALLGILNYILPRLGEEPLQMVRCNVMVANDQMRMAKDAEAAHMPSTAESSDDDSTSDDGSEDDWYGGGYEMEKPQNLGVEKSSWAFASIARKGLKPWSEDHEAVRAAIVSSINAQRERFARRGIEPEAVLASFYGLPNDLRKVATKEEVDSVCGIVIPPIEGLKECLEKMGAFGAQPYGNA